MILAFVGAATQSSSSIMGSTKGLYNVNLGPNPNFPPAGAHSSSKGGGSAVTKWMQCLLDAITDAVGDDKDGMSAHMRSTQFKGIGFAGGSAAGLPKAAASAPKCRRIKANQSEQTTH